MVAFHPERRIAAAALTNAPPSHPSPLDALVLDTLFGD